MLEAAAPLQKLVSTPGAGISNTWSRYVGLIGVSDDGEVLGVEHDKFDNEDKCRLHLKNLVNQHIGAEFSRLIRFEVQPIDTKTVVAVQCERSAKPVFLKGKNRESFYIRSGPSSVELSPREVLEYVNRRT